MPHDRPIVATAIPSGSPTRHGRPTPRAFFSLATARWLLLAGWLFIVAMTAVVGAKPAQLGTLESALHSGAVRSVSVTPGLPDGASGSWTQYVYWRHGFVRHRAEVLMVTPDTDDYSSDSGAAVRRGSDVATELHDIAPDVLITRMPRVTSYGAVYGWQVPTWLMAVSLVAIVATLMLLVSGPEPWHATRWAWFWLMTTPLGTVLFLVFGGSAPPIPAPHDGHRRLTGGMAFLIAILLSMFLPHWWHGSA